VTAGGDALREAVKKLPGRPGMFGLIRDPEFREVRHYPAAGGPEVVVSASRLPAVFWRIDVPATRQRWQTGTDVEDDVDEVASRIAAGDETVAGLIGELETVDEMFVAVPWTDVA
jgi:hypothetical protein